MRIGVIGCGNISGIYFSNLSRDPEIEIVACADLDVERAQRTAETWGIARASDPAALLNDREIDLVVNLTVPKAHAEVSLAAVRAGKHVYSEKPLATSVADGRLLMQEAAANGVTVGCAPDTVLGAGIQTCRELIDAGAIGMPVGANAFMLCPGHESWHPSPAFYYEHGGGPLLDMGPYYVSALVTLLGPIASVSGHASSASPTRTITSEPLRGTVVPVETPTHVLSTFRHANGALVHFTASFDVQRTTLPNIELYGTEGTLLVPDPNGFGGPIKLYRKSTGDWENVEIVRPYAENSRGLGVSDQVRAIREGRPLRASGALALHVLESMESSLTSAESGASVSFADLPERPEPMPTEAWASRA